MDEDVVIGKALSSLDSVFGAIVVAEVVVSGFSVGWVVCFTGGGAVVVAFSVAVASVSDDSEGEEVTFTDVPLGEDFSTVVAVSSVTACGEAFVA